MGIINILLRDQSTVPTPDSLHVNIFVDSTTQKPKVKNSAGTIVDFTGPTGTRGSQWTYGSAVPSASGLVGDMYLRTTGDVYQNLGGTSWTSSLLNLTGPTGPAVALGTSATDVSASASAGGSAATASKSDHTHFHGNQAGGALHSTVVNAGANGFMSGTDKTKLDTYGALSTTTPTTDAATTGAVGTSAALARADHQHAHGAQTDPTLHAAVTGSANGFMVSTDKSKLDTYGSLASSATDVSAAASAAGASTNLARQDHTHFHGNQVGGALHALATTSAAGFMSAATVSGLNNANVQYVNVRDFGAIADGSTDNTTAIQNAINSLPASGGTVYLPDGWYNINSPLTISNSNTFLVGQSKGSTLLRATFATGDILTITGWFCEVQQLQFYTTVNRTSGYAINAGGVSGSTVAHYFRAKELLIYGNQGVSSHYHGIRLGDTSLGSIEEVELRFFTGYGIHSDGTGDKVINRVITTNASASAALAGIRISSCASILINECNVITAGNALDIAPATGVTVPSIKVTNSFFDTSVNGLNMTSAGYFYRSEFTNVWFGSMSNAAINFAPTSAGGVDGITFVNCDLLNNVAGTTYGVQTNANVGRWRMSSSQVAGWNTGVNLVAGAAHYPSLTNNTIGTIAAFGVNTTGVAIAGGTYKGLTFRNNDIGGNTNPMNVATGITATDTQLLEISNNPGGLQQGVLSSVGATTVAIPVTTETVALNARIPANSVQPGQIFRITVLFVNGATAQTASIWRIRAGAAGTTADGGATPAAANAGGAVAANARAIFTGWLVVRSVGSSGTVEAELLSIATTTVPTTAAVATTPTVAMNATWYISVTLALTGGAGTIQQAMIEAL